MSSQPVADSSCLEQEGVKRLFISPILSVRGESQGVRFFCKYWLIPQLQSLGEAPVDNKIHL